MKVFAKSDIGKARSMNQDSYYISKIDEPIQLFVLADGMGGYNGGEIASRLAVQSVINYVKEHFSSIELNKEAIAAFIKQSIEYANQVVYNKSKTEEELSEMGTTLEVCIIYNNKVFIGHVGDSRVYRIRKQFIRKLTIDHSYVEKLVKDGTITREESYTHPKKNMLTKALGCDDTVEPDILVKGFLKNDIILMCSDGLTNLVSENEIYGILMTNVETAADNLIQMANNNGGLDNITVIIIDNH